MAHAPLRRASSTRRGVESDSSRQMGTGRTPSPARRGPRGRPGGSGCSMQRRRIRPDGPGPSTSSSAPRKDPLASTWRTRSGMVLPHGAHWLQLPPGLDLEADPRRAGVPPRRSTSWRSVPSSRSAGMPTTAPTGMASKPGPMPSASAMERPSASAARRRHRHLEGGRQHAVHRRAPEELGNLGPGGQMPAPGPAGLAQAGHPAPRGRLLHLVERRDRPEVPSASAAHSPHPSPSSPQPRHEEQRAHAVHAAGGADLRAERDLDPDQLHAGRALTAAGAPIPSP